MAWKRVSIRLSEGLHSDIQAASQAASQPLAEWVRDRLQEVLDAEAAPHGPPGGSSGETGTIELLKSQLLQKDEQIQQLNTIIMQLSRNAERNQLMLSSAQDEAASLRLPWWRRWRKKPHPQEGPQDTP